MSAVTVHYITRSGGHMSKTLDGAVLVEAELKRLRKRRTAATAWRGQQQVGGVGKLDGRWVWWLDDEAWNPLMEVVA